nr:cysteine and histidine rich protein 1 [Hymenolepis microstoma]
MNESNHLSEATEVPCDLKSDSPAATPSDNNFEQKSPKQNELLRVIQSIRDVVSCCACYTSDSCMKECANGHLICFNCFLNIRQEDRPQCPTCRAALFPETKRALTAQKVLSELPDTCVDCNQIMLNKELIGHRLNTCQKRKLSCGLSPLGCDWCGPAEDYSKHYEKCEIRKHFAEKSVEATLSSVLSRIHLRDQMLREIFTSFTSLFRHFEGYELDTQSILLTVYKTDRNSVMFKSDQFYAGQSRWVINLTVTFLNENGENESSDVNVQNSEPEIQNFNGNPSEEIIQNTSTHNSIEDASTVPPIRRSFSSFRHRRSVRFQGNYRSRPYPDIRRERTDTNNSNSSNSNLNAEDKLQGNVSHFGELNYTIIKENSPGVGRKSYAFAPLQIESADTGAQINFRPLVSTHRFLSRGEKTSAFPILPMRWRYLSNLRELLNSRLLNLDLVIGRKLVEEQSE